MPVDYVGFAYAATVAAGGIVGYARAGKILFKLPQKKFIIGVKGGLDFLCKVFFIMFKGNSVRFAVGIRLI
jgi:hypothetical protein